MHCRLEVHQLVEPVDGDAETVHRAKRGPPVGRLLGAAGRAADREALVLAIVAKANDARHHRGQEGDVARTDAHLTESRRKLDALDLDDVVAGNQDSRRNAKNCGVGFEVVPHGFSHELVIEPHPEVVIRAGERFHRAPQVENGRRLAGGADDRVPRTLLEMLWACERLHADVRLIPQTHRAYGAL